MSDRQTRVPSYRHHKPTNRAVVTLNKRDIYLGVYGSAESQAEYRRLIAEWLGGGRLEPLPRGAVISVAELAERYLMYAEQHYRDAEGRPTKQIDHVKRSLAAMVHLYLDTDAVAFGPRALRAVRDLWVNAGMVRRSCNQRTACIVRAFKWAASEELIPVTTYQSLCTVPGLQAGRTAAPDNPPVPPAPQAAIEATLAELGPVLRAAASLQLVTGMRPGELLSITPGQIDQTGEIWRYQPGRHKTKHHGHGRTILIGPSGQELLRPYLDRPAGAPCFSPRDAVAGRLGFVPNAGDRTATDRYSVSGYGKAIRDACDRANTRAGGTAAHRKVPRWTPHQLRHTAATGFAKQFGWDTARILLGHRSLDATRIYAEDDMSKAADAAKRAG